MNVCKSCTREVIWAVTDKGTRMILDAQPVPHGNIIVRRAPDGSLHAEIVLKRQIGKQLTIPGTGEELRYQSHFVSCPDADEWRNQHSSKKAKAK